MEITNVDLQEQVYFGLLLCVGIPSIIGSGIITVSYIKNRSTTNLAQKLLLLLSIGDALYVLSNIMNPNPDVNNTTGFCEFQAWLKQAASQSTYISSFWISYTTYKSLVRNQEMTLTYQRNVKLACVIPPIITACIPLLSHGYEAQIYSCSFISNGYKWMNFAFLFYGPFLILTISSLFCVYKIIRFYKYLRPNPLQSQHSINRKIIMEQNIEIINSEKITKYLLYYPLIQAFCWAPFTLYEIMQIFNLKDFIYLGGLRYIFACSQGFANAIIHQMRKKIKLRQVIPTTQSMISEYYDPEDTANDDMYRGSLSQFNLNL